MKLLVQTPSGLKFTIPAHLTGKFDNYAMVPGQTYTGSAPPKLNVVEVTIAGSDCEQRLWVKPEDLFDDLIGCGYHDRELREMLATRNKCVTNKVLP